MKNFYNKSIIYKLAITLIIGNVFLVDAQVRKAFTQRTSTYTPTKKIYNVQGDFTMLGNTNLTPQNYSATTNNNGQSMQYVDIDGDPTTMNSSSATLALSTENGASPECSKIIYAGLYWTGATSPNNTFSVTKQVKNGGTQTINNNLTFGHGNNLTNTNYSLAISRNNPSKSNRNPIYTFSGNGKTYAFSFYNSGATNRVTLTTTGLTTNLTNSPIAATINGSQTEATLTTPFVINDGTINITITKLIRSADTNLNTENTQSTSTVVVNINGTVPTYVSLTKNFDKRKISLKGPNAGSYTQFTAATSDIYHPAAGIDDNLFSAYVEVTDYVKTNGIGTYLAADIALLEGDPGGTGYSGGWGMIVVYENSKMKYRDVTIFDGYAYVSYGNTSNIQLPVSGFNTVQTGDVGVKLGVMASEGDVSFSGDFFKIQKLNSNNYLELNNKNNADGTPNTTPITTSNFFNSTIIAGGQKNPDLVNNTGIDINMFKVPNTGNTVIGNNQTSTNFQYGTVSDTYSIFTIAMSVDAYIPVVDALISPVSVNGTSVGSSTISALPGDVLNFKVDITNKGTEAVNNTKIVIPIPYTADFVNGSLTKNINFTPLPTPNNYYFDPALGPKGSIVFDLGNLPLPANPNTILANFSFNLKITTDCGILKNSLCNQNASVSGLISGTGAITGVNFSDKALYVGYTSVGNCIGEPILNPLIININSTAYVANNCPDTNIREFVYCTSNPTIPVTDISGGFPSGSLFYNQYPITNSTTQYSISNPFPATSGSVSYYAIPPGASDGCYFPFTIKVTNVTTMPTTSTAIQYCQGATALPLTATATNPAYTLFYFTSENGTAQLSLTPSTATPGQTTYYVAEAASGSCIGPKKAIVVTVTPKPTKVSTPVTICSGETYTWAVNNTAYTVGGTYTKTNDGCTADQELVLTVTPKPTKVSTPVTICSGETYTWAVNGTTYNVGGTYTKTNDGCTADQELVLTVTPKPTKVSTPVTICSGETYTWAVNGTTYDSAGTYTKTNDGCTADQELVLTVTPKPTKVSTPVTICSDETYTWAVNGTAYTVGGTYTKTNDGCTADQELVLTVTPKPTKVSTPVTICSGETYTWAVNGTTYNVGGTYTKTNDGCTADQELVLTVTPKPTKVSTPVTICSGETYTWAVNGTTYNVGGTYTKTNDGCTADQELVLTVTPKPTKVSTPVTICSGETYTWAVNGTTYNVGGTYTKTNDGCTADQELVLTVTPKPTKVSTPVTICSGETYTWAVNNTAYTIGGTYTKVNDGCTADQELVLTVTPKPTKVSTPVTICSGETYTWAVNGTTYDAAGTYTKTNDGCTADQELVLTVTPKPTKVSTPVTICSGETYTWAVNGTTYNVGGTYTKTNDGCTADQELVLTVTPKPTKVSTPVTICSGETYTWAVNGTAYNVGGTYTKTNDGCTADQELVLTVTPKPTKVSTPVTICSGETYTWAVNGTAYTVGGTYTKTNDGCTADQELVLTVTPKPTKVSTPVTICSGETYTWAVNGTTYNVGGTYTKTNDGCTADQELVLTVTPKPTKVSTPVTICSGETYTWAVNGTAYNVGGTYTKTNDGCTADQELVLTVTPKPTKVSTPVTICSGETYTWAVNGTAYNVGGTYTKTNDGCTADQELVLTVTPKPTKVSTPVTICSGETYTWAVNGTAYTVGGTYTKTNDGCTADQELVLTVTPKPTKVSTPVTICSGETYTWAVNGTAYTVGGTYTKTNDGCTADQELVLTVTPKPTKVSTPVTICSGETYTWAVNGTTYNVGGTYTKTNDGCTADQELVLTVTPKPTKVSTPVTICSGETYTWAVNGTTYDSAGTYTKTNDGCTADQELVLTVTPKPTKVSTPVTICSGETYTWAVNGTTYNVGGTYTKTNDGCTADQELVLTVTPKPTKVSTPVTICSGETYTWAVNNTAYTIGGTYTKVNDGCTADQELVLTVTPKPTKVSTPVTICSGETYTWAVNGTTYDAAGTYTKTNDGCTADQELVLTVTPKPTKVSTPVTICSGETYTWAVNGTTYNVGGTYTKTNDGCTADQELVLTVTPKPTKVSTPVTICSGETYTWAVNGTAYNVGGTYTKTNDGCTADQELVLTVTPKPTKVSTPVTICSGETYTWAVNGTAYTVGGTYTKTNDGCTADQELVLTVTPKPTKVSTPVTICSGETYTWAVNGTTYNVGGTYTKTNDGCTADQELVLTVTPKPTKVSTPVTICSGETYTWAVNGTAYNVGGTYTKTNDGCTADQELVLTVTPKPTKVSTPVTICSGETYTWAVNGTAYNVGGTYTKTNDGCTADQELVLTVTPKPTKVSTPVTICSGETYTWAVNGTAYTVGGTYTKTNDGCTADQELVLTVTPKPTKVSTPVTICSGETYTWAVNGTAYTVGGTYTKTNDGCTADQELVLTVTPKPTKVSTPVTICSGETYTWAVNGTTYNVGGTYTKTNDGCTADQELVLTVTPKPTKVSTPVTICSGETYTWAVNGTTYDSAGTYTKTNDGCTADQELVLTVTPKPTKVSTPVTICSGETYTWAVNNTAYTVGGTYTKTNDGCTADQELVLTVTPKPTKVSTPVTICSGETYTWAVNGTAYTVGGTYTKTNDGCTADQELVLTVTPKPTKVSTPVTICSGETYTWAVNGTTYDSAGTYTKTNDGCTAHQELVLTVTPKPTKVSTPVTICSGETYTWAVNGTAYTVGGTYTKVNDGCTADQELVLTINQLTASKEVGTISCKGGTTTVTIAATGGIAPYTNIGEHIVHAGAYSFDITDAMGCKVTVSGTISDGDGTPPVFNQLPSVTTINCPATPMFAQAIATDSTDSNVSLTFADMTTNGACAGAYSVTRTWTAKDACGNTSTATQTINVIDTTAPVIAVPPTRLSINCPETPVFGEATAMDECGSIFSLTHEDATTAGTCAGSYSVTRTWTAKDACGNTSTATQTIRVRDITAPTIVSCAPNQTLASNSNCQAIVPDFTKNVTASDACTSTDSLIITQSPAAGTVVQSGTTTILITVKDACGNESTCESKLIVTNFIVANDDAGTPVNGYNGGVSFTNVLSNDLLNCKTANTDNVNISFVSSTNTAVTLSGTNVIVAPGTPAGSYSLVYQICEKLNPDNCDTATVTVNVTAPVIDAVADVIAGGNGNSGNSNVGNVLVANPTNADTLNGTPVTIDQVNLTIVTPATAIGGAPVPSINTTNGQVSVPAGTPAGTYTIVYQICEKLNPTNCDAATVTITVTAPAIIAQDDAIAGGNGTVGNTNAGNVLDNNGNGNDTLNSQNVAINQVNLTITTPATPIGNAPVPVISTTTGQISIPAGTPAGTYVIVYNICDKLNPANCDSATVTITVTVPAPPAPVIIAQDDKFIDIDGANGNSNAGNVLKNNGNGNDTLNGVNITIDQVNLTVTIPAVSIGGAPVPTIDGTTGQVSIPAGTPAGTYTIVYSICDKLSLSNCDTATVTIEVAVVLGVGCEAIVVHKAFTPNGDGTNEKLVIDGVDDNDCYPSGVAVEIYNRWGVLVFETTKYDNETNAFEGYSKGRTTISKSDGLPTGTYFYIVNYESFDGNGNIQINKKDGFLYLSR